MLSSTVVDTSVLRGRELGGRIVVNVAGNSDLLLSPEQAGAGIITYSGQLTGSITVRLPLTNENQGFSWLIDNQSSGAFILTTAGPTGAGVAVPQGRKAFLGWNGVTIFTMDDVALRHETVSIPVGSTADLVLTNLQYKCGHIAFTGAPGGAFNVILPQSPGLYVLDNRTNVALVAKATTGLGITIAAGRAAIIRHDGTDARRVTADQDPTTGQV